jgi:hypothetical protein
MVKAVAKRMKMITNALEIKEGQLELQKWERCASP